MKTLAITGSSGSGKTTISELFGQLDETFLINADELARDMAENDKKYLKEIILYFGENILNEKKELNRKKLSYIIAENDDAKKELNKITKRNILPKIDKMISENSNKKLIIVDIPVLYENQLENYFDKVLAIISDKCEQIERIKKRDGLNQQEAEARINMQLNNEFFLENADFVINNYGKTKDQLYKEVVDIYFKMLREY